MPRFRLALGILGWLGLVYVLAILFIRAGAA